MSASAGPRRTLGMAESTLRTKDRMRHVATDPQILLSVERMRALLAELICPYCGRGPYKVIAMHTSRAHGIGGDELRLLSGLDSSDMVAPDTHEAYSTRAKRDGIANAAEYAEAMRRGMLLGIAARRAEVLADWEDTSQDWPALVAMAEKTGRTKKTMQHYLKTIGAVVPDGRLYNAARKRGFQ